MVKQQSRLYTTRATRRKETAVLERKQGGGGLGRKPTSQFAGKRNRRRQEMKKGFENGINLFFFLGNYRT
jgi:hypothetical protein